MQNRKIIVTLIAFAVSTAALLFFVGRSLTKTLTANLSASFIASSPTPDPQKQDFDNDGLYDQEEYLYRTDPDNPDSDRDGYLDGEEIAAGCNALSANLDCATSYRKFLEAKDQKEKESRNLTDLAARLSIGAILSGDILQNTGDLQTAEENMYLLTDGIAEFGTKLFTIEENLDFPTNDNNTPEAIRSYISKLTTLTERLISFNPDIARLQLTTSPHSFADTYSRQLTKLLEEERKMIVPNTWANIHQQVVDITRKYITFFEGLRQQNEDPLKAIIVLNYFPILNEELKAVVYEILVKLDQLDLAVPTDSLFFLLSLTK